MARMVGVRGGGTEQTLVVRPPKKLFMHVFPKAKEG